VSRIAIVIVSYNARADLERCLDSLITAPPADAEIVVADNGSTDGSADLVSRFAGVTLLRLGENRGFSAGNNAAIRASGGELLLLLNSDTIVPPGAIERLAAILEARPRVGVVGPRLIGGDGVPELSFGSMMTPLSEWRQRRLRRRLSQGDQRARSYVDTVTASPRAVDWVSGACLMVRRRDAEAVGLLDERFFMYTEDVDFCAAIRARGLQVLFSPEVEIVHLRGRSAASAPTATRAAYERSHLAFYRKHHPWLAPFVQLYHLMTPSRGK
jgi:GT2 family glycosyltransferase